MNSSSLAPLVTQSPWWRGAVWSLRLAIALQCFGHARLALEFGTPLFSFLWAPPDVGGLGWNEAAALMVDRAAGWCLIAAGLLVVVRPCWPVLVPLALWQLAVALAAWRMGGTFFYSLSLATQAVRIATPLALVLFDPWPVRGEPSRRQAGAAIWLLRLAVAATFVGHGLEAIYQHPLFIDYVIGASSVLVGWPMPEQVATRLLLVVGVIDLAVALLLIGRKWRLVAFYMAFWGALTALSRVVHAGTPAWHEVLLRAAHCGAPLAIGLYWMAQRKILHSGNPPYTQPLTKD